MKHEGSEGFGRNYAKSVSPCSDPRLHAPAAQRNGEAIRQELHRIHRAGGCILEVASGPGQHVACFADEFSDMRWQPSDPDPRMRASQDAWTHALPNVHKPLDLDVLHVAWWKDAGGPYDAVLCINMLHCTERETIRGIDRRCRKSARTRWLSADLRAVFIQWRAYRGQQPQFRPDAAAPEC